MTTVLEPSRQLPGRWSPPGAGVGAAHESPTALLAVVRACVAEAGGLLPMAPRHLPARQYELLELTDDLEIWAIHWPKDQRLELHDHGGSAGALWVVQGRLEEHVVARNGSSVRRSLGRGEGAAFGPDHIHDVVNPSDNPATSVHAYSPPMESMTFYRREARGLVVERAEYRADPAWAP